MASFVGCEKHARDIEEIKHSIRDESEKSDSIGNRVSALEGRGITHDQTLSGDGIKDKLSVKLSDGGGLVSDSSGISVKTGPGLTKDSDGKVVVKTGSGIEVDESGAISLGRIAGDGLTLEDGKLKITVVRLMDASGKIHLGNIIPSVE